MISTRSSFVRMILPGGVLSLCLALCPAPPAAAQAPTAATEEPAPSPPTTPPPVQGEPEDDGCPAEANAVVTDAYREVADEEGSQQVDRVKLRDTLTVEIAGLASLRRAIECAARENRQRSIVLFLDDHPLTSLREYPPTRPTAGIMRFPLRREEESRDVWVELLGKPKWSPRTTRVSVGFADGYAMESNAEVQLEVLPTGWFLFWLGILLTLTWAFWRLASRSQLLRDGGPSPDGKPRPFSLSRVQAAWWFFLVLTAYLLIGLVTGDYSTSITPTALILLGISAGTTISSVMVDNSRDNPELRQRQEAARLELEQKMEEVSAKATVAHERLSSDPQDAAAARMLADMTAAKSTMRSQLTKLNNQSERFWLDILSDVNGVNFHRFQLVGWTLVLGIVFIVEVYRNLAMPQFNATLLGLMGISSGAYVGLKGSEARVPEGRVG